MYQNININKRGIKTNKNGFTLVELLVAVAILGIISTISVQMLYDGVTLRAKQYSLETSSESIRTFVKQISTSIIGSKNISISADHSKIYITGEEVCETYAFADQTIKYSNMTGDTCTPPESVVPYLLNEEITISDLSFFSEGDPPRVVNIYLEGVYKDSLGDHPIKYMTSVTPRI